MIYYIERNIHGAWVIHGEIGIRQYYGYCKRDAYRKYREEAKKAKGGI